MIQGSIVQSPNGRLFRVDLLRSGVDSQARPLVALRRLDRQPREQLILLRPLADVEQWEVVW